MFEGHRRKRKHSEAQERERRAESSAPRSRTLVAMSGMHGCSHSAALPAPEPEALAETCPECVVLGQHPVQLRKCLICGHIACCDSSPSRHATAHFHATGHPVMRSFEPGESWRWCYEDRSLV
ncbi:ubiquitin-hydrolase Zn-finger-containing protein [Streptomyces sp. 846.5]|nr:ubiquitin-hydrolase Zn-finger-containing protein [Streptomyces sp. 846.5]